MPLGFLLYRTEPGGWLPDQRPLTEQGTWGLNGRRHSINTATANGKKVTPKAGWVETSHQPLGIRLPVKSGAWFLVVPPVEASQ